MIRQAVNEDFPHSSTDECLIRIISQKRAYGCGTPFLQFFTDTQGGFLSIMDGVAILFLPSLTDEWCAFLSMHADIHVIHCPGDIGKELKSVLNWQSREGAVMRFDGAIEKTAFDICTKPYLPEVHHLLDLCFPNMAPLDFWYPDASHRIRHNQCHIACIKKNEHIVSTAMTVAETETEAIIGQVATDADFRRQGMAETCVKSVVFQCKGKTLYILPLNSYALNLYQKIGFISCGMWAELSKLSF